MTLLLELQILTGRGVRIAWISPAPGTSTRELTPQMNPCWKIGATIAWSVTIFWIWCSRASRFFPVELLGLLLEQVVDLGPRPVGVEAALGEERLEPRRRVAGRRSRR